MERGRRTQRKKEKQKNPQGRRRPGLISTLGPQERPYCHLVILQKEEKGTNTPKTRGEDIRIYKKGKKYNVGKKDPDKEKRPTSRPLKGPNVQSEEKTYHMRLLGRQEGNWGGRLRSQLQ